MHTVQTIAQKPALVKIFNAISLALGTGKKVVLCLLDLSAAFDTLKHSVLIDCLREIGLQDEALEWFQSYLSDRRMAVKIKEHVSELPSCKIRCLTRISVGTYVIQRVLSSAHDINKKIRCIISRPRR